MKLIELAQVFMVLSKRVVGAFQKNDMIQIYFTRN